MSYSLLHIEHTEHSAEYNEGKLELECGIIVCFLILLPAEKAWTVA